MLRAVNTALIIAAKPANPDTSFSKTHKLKKTYIIFTEQLKWNFIYESLGYSNLL